MPFHDDRTFILFLDSSPGSFEIHLEINGEPGLDLVILFDQCRKTSTHLFEGVSVSKLVHEGSYGRLVRGKSLQSTDQTTTSRTLTPGINPDPGHIDEQFLENNAIWKGVGHGDQHAADRKWKSDPSPSLDSITGDLKLLEKRLFALFSRQDLVGSLASLRQLNFGPGSTDSGMEDDHAQHRACQHHCECNATVEQSESCTSTKYRRQKINAFVDHAALLLFCGLWTR
jgi:hypothetical protein